MRRRHVVAAALALVAGSMLAACDDFSLVAVTATPNIAALPSLPPIGFNHRFGNSPVASQDAFKLERSLFASRVFWEIAMRTDPIQAGYVKLSDKQKVVAARHAAKDIYLVMATEDRNTIIGMLAFHTHADQEAYCKSLLDAVVADGYDAITSATVLVFFTEADQHAKLSWTKKGGYTYDVYDNDLRGTALVPSSSATPLPTLSP